LPTITSVSFNRAGTKASQYTTAPFTNACQHLAIAAAKGTEWSGSSRAALQRVDEELGGAWMLAECKQYAAGHRLAGRPARALVHVTLWGFEEEDSSSSSSDASSNPRSRKPKRKKAGGADPQVTLFINAEATQTMSPGIRPFVHHAGYELNDDVWPTGKLHSGLYHSSV
jgi:hypothetical protein